MMIHEMPPPKLANGAVFRLRATYLSAFPVSQWLFAHSAMDVRSLYGCGAAGVLHPSSSLPFVFEIFYLMPTLSMPVKPIPFLFIY